MRFLLKATMSVNAANARTKEGKLGETIENICADLKPEACYFLAEDGERTAFIFLNMDDASQIPALAEPWFLAFDAKIEIKPVMVGEDLKKASKAIEEAVKKYS